MSRHGTPMRSKNSVRVVRSEYWRQLDRDFARGVLSKGN